MIQKNPYAAYNNSKIQTATPAELTLLLYEEMCIRDSRTTKSRVRLKAIMTS